MKTLSVSLALVAMLSASALAQGTTQTVLPLGFAGTPGNSNDGILETPNHIQQLFRGSALQGTWTSPVLITGVSFRVADGAGAYNSTIPQVEIHLSTSSRTPEQMSIAYASNRGSDETTVFLQNNVSLTGRSGQAVNPFDLRFTLDHPFVYDAMKGNLLMFITTTGPFRGAQIDSHAFSDINISPVAAVGSSLPVVDNIVVPYGLVTEFTWTTVPEPAQVTLLTLGTAALAAARKLQNSNWRFA